MASSWDELEEWILNVAKHPVLDMGDAEDYEAHLERCDEYVSRLRPFAESAGLVNMSVSTPAYDGIHRRCRVDGDIEPDESGDEDVGESSSLETSCLPSQDPDGSHTVVTDAPQGPSMRLNQESGQTSFLSF
jgi:hypothetical protein